MSWPGRRPAPGFTTRVPDFEAFFEALPAPCIVFAADDPRYTIVAVNDAYCQMVGLTHEELEGKVFTMVYASSVN